MKIKVYGGTNCTNLCLKCTNLREIQGTRESDTIRMCNSLDKPIPFEVARCSYYHEKDPDLSRYKGALNLTYNRKQQKLLVIENRNFFETRYLTIEQYREECAPTLEEQPKATEAEPKTVTATVN